MLSAIIYSLNKGGADLIAAILRSFNNRNLPEQVERLLSRLQLDYVVVAINADAENRGEENNGAYSERLLAKAFGQSYGKKLVVHSIKNWGKNPGSAAALNEAASALFYRLGRLPTKDDFLFNVSVESGIKPEHIRLAKKWFSELKNLAVVGVSRQIFMGESEEDRSLATKLQKELFQINRLQYQIPQNTAAFWRASLLRAAGGFRTECDFSGLTITIGGREVPVAGMEDFPTLCYLAKKGFSWAIIKDNPMVWDLSDIKKNPERWQTNLDKMKRQEEIMVIWAQKFFGLSLKQIADILRSAEKRIV